MNIAALKQTTPTEAPAEISNHLDANARSIPAPEVFQEPVAPDPVQAFPISSPSESRRPIPSIPQSPSSERSLNLHLETLETPFLVYKKHFETIDLRKLLPAKIEKVLWTAISPNTELIALLNKSTVFIVSQTSCKLTIVYSKTRKHKGEVPVVLSNTYVFIGAENRIEVFTAVGDHAGKLVCCDDVGATVRKLLLSQGGDMLLALVTKPRTQELRIYSLVDSDFSCRLIPSRIITWDGRYRIHCGLTISTDGNRIAIYTNECELGRSEIRFVRKMDDQWETVGVPLEVQTLPENPEERGSDNGITGAALY